MPHGFLIFHLNLSFSSIKTDERLNVIHKCYWPLLDLIERCAIPIGIELTGWTLNQIEQLDKSWIDVFRRLLQKRRCELIGSGWSQIIGPLVPDQVNASNQKLGLNAYKKILNVFPKLAFVNEMAFSTGMVDVYADAGYAGIIMDRDNVRLAMNLEHTPIAKTPTHALGCVDRSLPVLWSDTILFQRLQRVVHGDISISEYLSYVHQRAKSDDSLLPLYCNDAEIFDYRPGRFETEAKLHPEGEWKRLEKIIVRLQEEIGLQFLNPSDGLLLENSRKEKIVNRLTSIKQPIPVKKQAKYNINRWAVAGRDNLWLNTKCHQVFRILSDKKDWNEELWRNLCELWASDLRTHITNDRWKKVIEHLASFTELLGINETTPTLPANYLEAVSLPNTLASSPNFSIIKDDEGTYWSFSAEKINLTLNVCRGLTIQSLAFKSHNFEPVLVTLAQGFFNSIEFGVDYYSGGILIEVPAASIRVTDLEWVKPIIQQYEDKISISAQIQTKLGMIEKIITIHSTLEEINVQYCFHDFERPKGIVRVGLFTFNPETFFLPIKITCKNGGPMLENFNIDRDEINHGAAVSTLVSSTTALGATDGRLVLVDAKDKKL
ncbi:MAG: hypothetical protein ACD_35C00148G0003, partial [uncultured bacterium]